MTAANPIPPENNAAETAIAHALSELEANNPNETDGKWLEEITVSAAPHIKDWDIDQCWGWSDWPEREIKFPGVTQQDIGIDAVAVSRSDGGLIAIQCKARQLDETGRGADIPILEVSKFGFASAGPDWAQRWLVTNGDNRISGNTEQLNSMQGGPGRSITPINIHTALIDQQNAAAALRSKQIMQDEAVAESVRILREHVVSDSGGQPAGEARGRLILPCGTGKTRISLRIVEELTPPGELAIVLCPSIALVAQIRREYLQHRAAPLRAMAVCSDAGDPPSVKKENKQAAEDDQTADKGNVSAAEIKGKVTTDPDEIARWMQDDDARAGQLNVIFGTYQSGHRIAEALRQTGITAQVLIADEAHRTAGLRRNKADGENAKLRDFTLCHNNEMFPAVYRIYQTATPRIYEFGKVDLGKRSDWIVRTMDDEKTFGVELYRKSYREAVANGWLADYRIIALGVNDPEAYAAANELAAATPNKGRQSLTTTHFLGGLALALALGGATQSRDADNVSIKSCIAFMNTVEKSKDMVSALETKTVSNWLKDWLERNRDGQTAADFTLEHLDATSKVSTRDTAKQKLADANVANPHGIINVGIFGEGTDAPSLSAVAFLEARKSPIDVVQAVGRAMRTAPGKEYGYIICPIHVPPNADAETWLSTASPEDGWQELGQILLALRAHDSRIEDNLAELMQLYIPKAPEIERCLIAIAPVRSADTGISYWEYAGPPKTAEQAVTRVLNGKSAADEEFQPIDENRPGSEAPTHIVTGKKNSDGSHQVRQAAVVRDKPGAAGPPGKVNYAKSRAKAREMINKETDRLYVPQRTIVVIDDGKAGGVSYYVHVGPPGSASRAAVRVLDGKSAPGKEFQPLAEPAAGPEPAPDTDATPPDGGEPQAVHENRAGYAAPTEAPPLPEPAYIISARKNAAGVNELRQNPVIRERPGVDGVPGPVDLENSKAKGLEMLEKGAGEPITPHSRPTNEERAEQSAMDLFDLSGLRHNGDAIRVNLLAKSGLTNNRVDRDLNLLKASITEATYHLRNDELLPVLNQHFGLDNLKSESLQKQADGCTIAALLMMNAMMLHQRIANGGWLHGISSLATIKNDTNPIDYVTEEWGRIISHDFRPVLQPALDAIYAIKRTRKQGGLERALHHLAAAAEDIAETYADMGADHAGPLFNQVMGNQASDGAFFTRPAAASIAARLTLDACESPAADDSPAAAPDWTSPEVWRQHKAVDLACGSGTLLAALLTEMKRRARQQGAAETHLAALQKIAVEETIKGMDINPVSLQLAASQLTAGNHDIRYRKMGLHLMPYGPQPGAPAPTAAGTLELLGQQAIVPRPGALDLPDDQIRSQAVWQDAPNPELEDAVEAAKDARIVIMNPPFTERIKMGEKFDNAIQQTLRQRADSLERTLVNNDPEMTDFASKRSIAPLFVALAEKCTQEIGGVLTLIHPTIALSNPSGLAERLVLSQRYHIHTILTCHQPGQINLSQHTSIHESIIVAVRHSGSKPPTRFINLDRMPVDDTQVDDLHQCLAGINEGAIANGWGEVSWWPAERIEAGDWTTAIWRSAQLAMAAARFADDSSMQTMEEIGLLPTLTSPALTVYYEKAAASDPGSFPILKSKGADGQTRIESQPDEYYIPKNRNENARQNNGGTYPEADTLLQKAGYLLITDGGRNNTARLTATASDNEYVGVGWIPVPGFTATEAKALAVFINSTPGRLQLMRNQGRTLEFPLYRPAGIGNIRIPDIKDARIRQILAGCWEATRGMEVPQFRDGECGVRQRWDAAVAEALGWDEAELTRLRQLLHQEPHVRGLGYNQYADAAEG